MRPYRANLSKEQHFRQKDVDGALAGGKREARKKPAKIFAFLKLDRSSVDFGNVAHDRKAKTCPGLSRRVEPCAAGKELAAPLLRNPRAIVLDQYVDDR